jgi:isopentenyldiphosphate isomerase
MKTTDNQKELFIVVNEKDRFLEYRTRADCHKDKTLIHRTAGVAVFNKHGDVLVQKRSKTKDLYPGYFALSAAGHVSKGEKYKQAARREMFEEIGAIAPLILVDKKLLFLPEETEYDTLYKTVYEGAFNLNKDEVESVEFMPKTMVKLIKNKLTPYSIKCFMRLGIL